MSEHDARLAPSALLGMISCALVVTGAASWRTVAGTLMGAAVMALASVAVVHGGHARARARVRDVATVVAFACAVGTVLCVGAGIRVDARSPEVLRDAVHSHSVVTVYAEVNGRVREGPPGLFNGARRWDVSVEALAIDGVAVRVPMRVVVADAEGLDHGVGVVLRGTLDAPTGAHVRVAMWDAHIVGVHADIERDSHTIGAAIANARASFLALAEPFPARTEGLTAGMVIGDDSAMPEEQREEMRRSGLAHLTAVSGAHFAVLTLAVMWLVRRARWARPLQALAVAGVTVAFTALVGPEPSVVRAASMATVMSIAIAMGRRARALAALSASVTVLLGLDPWVATSLGFCLSVAAVAAIAVWAPHVAVRLERWLVPRAAHVVSIPVAAAAATAPLLVLVAGGIGTYVVPANVVAAPFAAPVTILGLMAMLVDPLAPSMSQLLVAAAAACVAPVDLAASAFANAPGAWITWPASGWGAMALAIVVALLAAASVTRRVRGWGLAAVCTVCVVALSVPAAVDYARTPRLAQWDVVACDVGQGDMLLLRTAPAAAVVVDVGRPTGGSVECLARHGIRRVDLLILTHPDSDHDGGVEALLAAVPVKRAWISPVAAQAPSTELLRRHHVSVDVAIAGTHVEVGAVRIAVLAPTTSGPAANDNDASIVILADAGGTTILALGDLEIEGQERLLDALPPHVIVDIVKIAHHGSATQSPALAARIRARIGVLSVGAANPYGHPAASALALYEPQTSHLLRTDECGDILVAAGPEFSVASRCPANVAG